jgi:hypothetical protein
MVKLNVQIKRIYYIIIVILAMWNVRVINYKLQDVGMTF